MSSAMRGLSALDVQSTAGRQDMPTPDGSTADDDDDDDDEYAYRSQYAAASPVSPSSTVLIEHSPTPHFSDSVGR